MSADQTANHREDEVVDIDEGDHSIVLCNRREATFRQTQEQDSGDSTDSSDSFPIDLSIRMCSEPALLFLVKIISFIINKRVLDEVFASLLEQKQKQYEEDIHILNSKVDALTQRLTSKNTQVCESCQHGRRNNLRISGLPEKKGDVTDDEVISIVAKIGVTLKKSDIDRSHRIGKPGRYNSANRSRPILVKLRSYGSKREIMVNACKLKRHAPNVFINEDLTKEQARLASATRKLVKRTHLAATWVQDGIIYAKKCDGHVVLLTRRDHLDVLMRSLNRKRKLKSLQTPVGECQRQGEIDLIRSQQSSESVSHRAHVPPTPDRAGDFHGPDNVPSHQSSRLPLHSNTGPPATDSPRQVRIDTSPSQQSTEGPDCAELFVQRGPNTTAINVRGIGEDQHGPTPDATERKCPVPSSAGRSFAPSTGRQEECRRDNRGNIRPEIHLQRSASSPSQLEAPERGCGLRDGTNRCNMNASSLLDDTGDSTLRRKKEEIVHELGKPNPLSSMKTGYGLLHGILSEDVQKEMIWFNSATGEPGPLRVHNTLKELSAHGATISYIVHYFVQEESRRLDIVKLIRNIHGDCPYCAEQYRLYIPQTP